MGNARYLATFQVTETGVHALIASGSDRVVTLSYGPGKVARRDIFTTRPITNEGYISSAWTSVLAPRPG